MKNLKTYKAFEAIDIKPELYKYIDNKDIESIKEFVNDYDNFSRLDTRYKAYTPILYCFIKIYSSDRFDSPDLYRIARSTNIMIIKLLLDAGADPDGENKFGLTPLIYITLYEDMEIIRILLDANADMSTVDEYGNTFFDKLNKENQEIIKQEYPEKYDRYIKKQKSNKFNL